MKLLFLIFISFITTPLFWSGNFNESAKDGKFPFTLLLDENGKVLKTWDGFPKENADQFVKGIAALNPKK